MTAKHIQIGTVKFLVNPERGVMFCSKLTLPQETEQNKDMLEVVNSWAINDQMEIEQSASS